MSNTISAILPILQDRANTVGRELVGFIPACYKNASAQRAGYNQVINYPIVPALAAAAVAPAATAPAGTDITQAAGSIVMDNLRKVSWNWTGEERRALNNGDIAPYSDIVGQTLEQAMRTLVNEIESSMWVAAYKGSSRGYGSATVAPFGTANDLTDFANIQKILDDNGTPEMDRHLVVGGAAMVNLRGKQSVLFKVNEAGTSETLRRGRIGEVMGLDVHNSYPIAPVTAGTNSGGRSDASGYAVGATTLTLDSNGTGTILAGDIIAITGDASAVKYVVKTGDTDVSNGGTVVLNTPGLRGTLSAATHAFTTTATYTPNVAFHRNALHLIMRAPDTGDDAAQAETVTVTDAFSGLVFQFARYPQYMQSSFELRVLYGVKAVKSDFIATLIG
jgi:hypothetical protein